MQTEFAVAMIAAPRWIERAPGLDTADAAVVFDGRAVDALALVRLDMERYELTVHWDASGPGIEDWQRTLAADVVINGSYFEPDHTPTTPLRSAGRALGPARYASSHGAIVIGPGVDIIDLRGRDVDAALAPYRDAMVSYPLLVAPGGETRAAGREDLVANRTFIGIDDHARIIIATTRDRFFSLHQLGETLRRSPLALRVALNLDGGPITSQVVAVTGWRRVIEGGTEVPAQRQVGGRGTVALPIVLAARRRSNAEAGATGRASAAASAAPTAP